MEDIYVSNKAMKKVKEIAFEKRYADFLKEGKPFKGYRCFIPKYKKTIHMGPPAIILAKGDEVKEVVGDEAFDYSEE